MQDMNPVPSQYYIEEPERTFTVPDTYFPYSTINAGHGPAMQPLFADLQKLHFGTCGHPDRLGKFANYLQCITVPVDVL